MNYLSIEEIIKPILERIPETRDNDAILYIEYCKKTNPSALNMRLEDWLRYRTRLEVASLESVGRARRKLQQVYKELRASKPAEDARYENWKETREYAFK